MKEKGVCTQKCTQISSTWTGNFLDCGDCWLVQSTKDQRAQINPTVTPSDNPNYSLQQKPPKQKQKVKQTQQQQQ